MKTMWWCERCHASGLSDLEGVSVYDALDMLAKSHDQHVLAQWMRCTFNTSTVRVAESVPQKDSDA
jgi:hypothetical protein